MTSPTDCYLFWGYGVFTAKHTDGFARWPTKTSVTHTATALRNFRDGRGDLARDSIKSLQPQCVLLVSNCQIAGQTEIFSYKYPWMITHEPHRALPPDHSGRMLDHVCSRFEETQEKNP